MLQTLMTGSMRAQQPNSLPKVLGIPETLDGTGKWVMDKVCDVAIARIAYPEQGDIPAWIRKNLRLDAARFGDLDMQIVETLEGDGFVVHNILFQSQLGVYVPANLYVPKGNGPFPAVINSHGHWPDAKKGAIVQQTAQLLARNGFVCLNMDAWGAGERGSNHTHEYHGASLGSSLLDLGIPLMGMQLLDNQRAIDLLQSLPYVDANSIGATGASGGGNQTWWLAALDERIKAVVPVVSVGTFESYIMNSNCVCELHPNGLASLEKADIIASMAPRPIKILTALQDGNAAFNVREMLKTYHNAKKSYDQAGCGEHLVYELFDEKHDYTKEMQLSMLQWFDHYLKAEANNAIDTAFRPLDGKALTVGLSPEFKSKITTTVSYAEEQDKQMQDALLEVNTINRDAKIQELRNLLLNYQELSVQREEKLSEQSGYERIILTATDRRLVPLLMKAPSTGKNVLHVLFPSRGTASIDKDSISRWTAQGEGMIVVDLFGLGERSSKRGDEIDGRLPRFHTLSRSLLWMGESMMGTWASEIGLVLRYLEEQFPHMEIRVVADRETAVASLIYSVLDQYQAYFSLADMPLSYVPDYKTNLNENGINMAVHIPGIIPWGNIVGLIGLSPAEIAIEHVIGMSGQAVDEPGIGAYAKQIKQIRITLGNTSNIHLLNNSNLSMKKKLTHQ